MINLMNCLLPILNLATISPNVDLLPKNYKSLIETIKKSEEFKEQIIIPIEKLNGEVGSTVIGCYTMRDGEKKDTAYVLYMGKIINDQRLIADSVSEDTLRRYDGKAIKVNMAPTQVEVEMIRMFTQPHIENKSLRIYFDPSMVGK